MERKKAAYQAAALSALQRCLEKLPGDHLQQVAGPLLAIVQRHREADAAVSAPKVSGLAAWTTPLAALLAVICQGALRLPILQLAALRRQNTADRRKQMAATRGRMQLQPSRRSWGRLCSAW